MKRILLLLILLLFLLPALAEQEEEAPFTPGPASLFEGTEIFSDEERAQSAGKIESRLIVWATALITGEDGRQALEIYYLADGELRMGYVKPVNASFLAESEIEAYLAGIEEPDGYYAEFPLLNAIFKQEEPEKPDEPDRPKRNKQVRITGEERGTPGVYTHVKGDWETVLYWGTDMENCETMDGILLSDGEPLGISGENLTAAVEGENLVLTGGSVKVSGEALLTLRESGISAVDVGGILLPTGSFLSGDVYASLRAAGIGDRKIDYEINGGTILASVHGEQFGVLLNGDTWELERSSQ